MTRHAILTAFALAVLPPAISVAQHPTLVLVQDAWARATPPGASTGAVYMTLISPNDDKLTGVTSGVAQTASVHDMRMVGNVMHMRPVEGGLDLPAGQPVTLAPNGHHIMLEGLRAPLKQGQTVPVRLTFQKAPPVEVEAQVRPIGAPAPSTSGKGPAAMSGMTMSR